MEPKTIKMTGETQYVMRKVIDHLKEEVGRFEQIGLDTIDGQAGQFPPEMIEQAKRSLSKQYDVFRFILDSVILVDPAPIDELPS